MISMPNKNCREVKYIKSEVTRYILISNKKKSTMY